MKTPAMKKPVVLVKLRETQAARKTMKTDRVGGRILREGSHP